MGETTYSINGHTTDLNKKEPLRWLGIFADALFVCGVFGVFPAFIWLAYWLQPQAWLPAMVIATLFAAGFIIVSWAISMIHTEMLERLKRIEELEKRINELNDILTQK